MAGDNERDERSGNAGATKEPALSRFLDSDTFLFIVLLGLGALTFGWVIFPALGSAWGIINGTIIIAIIVTGIVTVVFRAKKGKL